MLCIISPATLDFSGSGSSSIAVWRSSDSQIQYKWRTTTGNRWSPHSVNRIYPVQADCDGDGKSKSVQFGEVGDTLLSGCHFFSSKENSLAIFHQQRRIIRARDLESATIKEGAISSVSLGDLLGCSDVDGDGIDEVIFRTPGNQKAQNMIQAFKLTGKRVSFRSVERFTRGVVARQSGSKMPLIAILGAKTGLGHQVRIEATAGSFAFPLFYVANKSKIGTGIFREQENGESLPGLYWVDTSTNIAYMRLFTRNSKMKTLFSIPTNFQLLKAQNIIRTINSRR